MEEKVYQNALARRTALMKELADLDTFIQMYERLAGMEPSQGVVVDGSPLPEKKVAATHKPRKRINRSEDIARMTRMVLLARNKPMTRGEIVDALEDRGVTLGGADKSKNIGTILWRLKDQFINLEGHGYWIRDLPYPEADYDPNDPNSEYAVADTLDLEPKPADLLE